MIFIQYHNRALYFKHKAQSLRPTRANYFKYTDIESTERTIQLTSYIKNNFKTILNNF